MHLEAVIDRVWRFTGRPCASEFRDALRGRGRVNSEMQCEAMIERVWRCNWTPRLSELGDTLGGCDQVSFGHALGGRDRVN